MTETVELPRGQKKGHWLSVEEEDGSRSALICCPKCGKWRALSKKHNIQSDGTVKGSFWCKIPGAECGYHVYLKLIGWQT